MRPFDTLSSGLLPPPIRRDLKSFETAVSGRSSKRGGMVEEEIKEEEDGLGGRRSSSSRAAGGGSEMRRGLSDTVRSLDIPPLEQRVRDLEMVVKHWSDQLELARSLSHARKARREEEGKRRGDAAQKTL